MTTENKSSLSIGEIIRDANDLSPEQVQQVLDYQQKHKVKFGEAAVALGIVRRDAVLWALSQQFCYAYSTEGPELFSDELVVARAPFSLAAESFREYRSQLLTDLFQAPGPKRALAITSPDTGDGKTYFAANLAVAFSQLGRRTLLVDADMRTPRLSQLFGVEPKTGLSSFLSGRGELAVMRPIAELPNLYFLPVGILPPNPQELLQQQQLALAMNEFVNKFDYVIVDTPALARGVDSRITAMVCGASLAIARKGSTNLSKLAELVEYLSRRDHRFMGVLMNDFNAK